MIDFNTITLHKASKLIRDRELSPVELAEAHLARIRALNPTINAYVRVAADSALRQAKSAEEEMSAGKYRGPLHGVPMSVKDIFNTTGIPTAFGEARLRNNVPNQDAAIVERLKAAGAVIVGKTNPLYGEYFPEPECGLTRNPWDLDRLPGYSSSGGGAAVAAGCDLASIGSDGGGSVRYPASCTATVGLKPTFGRVSRYGATVYGIPNDYIGPLTRTVHDCALVMRILAGHDPRDPYSAAVDVPDYPAALSEDLRGVRVGVPKEYFWDYLDPEVESAVRGAVALMGEAGATVVEVSLPSIDLTNEVHTMLSESETAAYYQPLMDGFPPETPDILYQRIEKGSRVKAGEYIRARETRRRVISELDEVFEAVDVIATPSSILPPPVLGRFEFTHAGREWIIGDLASRLTRSFNMTGHPAISIPCGFAEGRLPIGLQLAAPNFAEATLLRTAHAYERLAKVVNRWPL